MGHRQNVFATNNFRLPFPHPMTSSSPSFSSVETSTNGRQSVKIIPNFYPQKQRVSQKSWTFVQKRPKNVIFWKSLIIKDFHFFYIFADDENGVFALSLVASEAVTHKI